MRQKFWKVTALVGKILGGTLFATFIFFSICRLYVEGKEKQERDRSAQVKCFDQQKSIYGFESEPLFFSEEHHREMLAEKLKAEFNNPAIKMEPIHLKGRGVCVIVKNTPRIAKN